MLNALLTAGAGIWLLIVAIVFAAVSVYYYFKLIQAMYFTAGEPAINEIDKNYEFKLWIIAVILIVLGVFPNVLFSYLYF